MSVEFLTLADCSLAYQRQFGDRNKPGIFFLSGFASDMTGTKAAYLADFCEKEGLSFVRFDYRGCGQSPGKFIDGTIGNWLTDSIEVFAQLTRGPQIIVGSSMGGWIGLLLAQKHRERTKAFIGIAAAPDFTENLIWKKLTPSQQDELVTVGQIYDPTSPPDHQIPITAKFVEEARRHLILRDTFPLDCPVRLIQGKRDREVPWEYAGEVAAHVVSPDLSLIYQETGDHRLSTPQDLAVLKQVITSFI